MPGSHLLTIFNYSIMVPVSGELSPTYFGDLKGTSNIKGEILTTSNILSETSTSSILGEIYQ